MALAIQRRFTRAGELPYAAIEFRLASSEIRSPDGSVVFRLDRLEAPSSWSQVAIDVLAQKYLRKAGIPAKLKVVREKGVPAWLCRRVADQAALAELPEAERHGSETGAQQVFDRLAGTWTYWGWKGGYFADEADARTFFDELRYMLAAQMAAPNSPQWFNTGLYWAYGIDGPAQGHFYVDESTGKVHASTSAYERPQPHACFIQSVKDDLVNDGGIMDLWVREARLFKYGSGTGTNFSSLRGEGERLSGGGKSSGLMSFLKIGDRAAGCDQVGRHHAPRGQDGDRRRRSSRHRSVRRLEGGRGAEGGGAGRRLPAAEAACGLDHGRLPRPGLCRCGPVRPARERRPAQGGARCAPRASARRRDPADHPLRQPGLHRDRDPDLRRRLGQRRLPDRVGPELEQHGPGQRRLHAGRAGEARLAAVPAHRRQGGQDAQGRPALGSDGDRGMGQCGSRRPVRQHDQRLAHLPGRRADQRVEPVLGVHVPRRHRLQPGVAQPDLLPARGRHVRGRRVRARRPAVDDRARDLGADGPVPGHAHRRAVLPLPHPRARLRQSRRAPDGVRPTLRQRCGPCRRRRHHRPDDRHRLQGIGRDGGGAGCVPGLCRQPGRCPARAAQPSPGRLERDRRL